MKQVGNQGNKGAPPDAVHKKRDQLLRRIREELKRATVRELEVIWAFARNLHLK